MKWFDPSVRDGNYFQLKYLSYSVFTIGPDFWDISFAMHW